MIKLAICDDEISAIQNLYDKIVAFMKSKGYEFSLSKYVSGESFLFDIIERQIHFDAVFLDIGMTKINGIDTAKQIRKVKNTIHIIFVTALKEYVFDAFDVNADNYLIKPIENKRLHKSLNKLIDNVFSGDTPSLIIYKGGEIKKIPLCNIMYCEVMNHQVFVYEQNNTHEYNSKIGDLEQELTEDFFRCHRSYIVNLKYVDSYSKGFAYLPSGEKIPIATRRQQSFMKALLHFQRKEVR